MTEATTTAAVIPRMVMRRTRTVLAAVGEMAGAIVPASTFTIPGKGITVAAAIIRSSITVGAVRSDMRKAVVVAASSAAVVVEAAATAAAADTAKINVSLRL